MNNKRIIGVVAVALFASSVILLIFLPMIFGDALTALSLTLTLVIAVTVLLATLVLASWILKCVNLSNPNEALGLPTGSVRAIIALALILIFAIMSIFMFQLLTEPQTTTTLTQQSFSNVTGGNTTFTNTTQVIKGTSADVIDFSKQMLTTISTLVVAIAAFYFGTRSVARAQGSEEEAELYINPLGEKTVTVGDSLDIVVKPKPEDADYVLKIEPTEENSNVNRNDPARLIYKPTAPKSVTFTFTMPKYDDVDPVVLKVTVQPKT